MPYINPPFHCEKLSKHLKFLNNLATKSHSTFFVIYRYVPTSPWFLATQHHQVHILHFTRPLVFHNREEKVWSHSTNTVVVLILGAKGPTIQVKNTPAGIFYLATEITKNITFPLPPLDYEEKDERTILETTQTVNTLVKSLNYKQNIENACEFLTTQQKSGLKSTRFEGLFEETIAENLQQTNVVPKKMEPEYIKSIKKENVATTRHKRENFSKIRSEFPKQFELCSPSSSSCRTCGQATHTEEECWRKPLTWSQLGSSDLRDKTFLRLIRNLGIPEKVRMPKKVTAQWLVNDFCPQIIKKEKRLQKYLEKGFKRAHPKQTLDSYLQKYRCTFSRIFWGVTFAFAIGVEREAVIRMFFGIPRHNALDSDPYEVSQELNRQTQAVLHKIHEKKVQEGKLLRVDAKKAHAILTNFIVHEKDKDREIVDGFPENILHPR